MFITFEGPEGAGKSTALRAVAERLREAGRAVLTTREPGAGEFGGRIREILLHGDEMPAESELFLFLADRASHVRRVIRPALERGEWVLCDRYADSTLVYQAYVRRLDADFVRRANRFATGGLVPDRTFLLDLDPEIGLARLTSRDRLDAQPIEFHRAVRAGFLNLASEEPHRWRILDASSDPKIVIEAILNEI
ncbi:dTMP kinase [Fimbriimonas ginsengisoli]|uniref:Thymidylate kinase n=1 Tax=Fimbriimonas ginsengisoli Gsoil 348 TaxID=661478 RepID=A0A068NKQ8_FIMGI|nr:dTMP kinase [Fimbriimonas ginsengisoli]AIE84163.1 thymidylate kinase [Fimbriimonas ginsengisoli Gsoil 348]